MPRPAAPTPGAGRPVSVVGRLRSVLAYRDVRTLCAIFLITQAIDALTTSLALRTHRFSEGNPWLDEAVATHPGLTYAIKLGAAFLIVLALLLMRLRWRLRNAVLALFALISMVAPMANALRMMGWLA